MTVDDRLAEFNKQMDDLWYKYLGHCAKDRIDPVSKAEFAEAVESEFTKIIAHKIGDKDLADFKKDDGREALYIAMRVADITKPVKDSVIKQCGQCGADVWVDTGMSEHLKAAKSIICNQCLPEVAGKTREEVIKEKMEQL